MQIIVIGCGKIGIKFAKKMSSLNNDVTMIESDKELTKKFVKEFDGRVINGLEFDKAILEYTKRDRRYGNINYNT